MPSRSLASEFTVNPAALRELHLNFWETAYFITHLSAIVCVSVATVETVSAGSS
jgi:hypothetical protein